MHYTRNIVLKLRKPLTPETPDQLSCSMDGIYPHMWKGILFTEGMYCPHCKYYPYKKPVEVPVSQEFRGFQDWKPYQWMESEY